jgi:hypothetical protein
MERKTSRKRKHLDAKSSAEARRLERLKGVAKELDRFRATLPPLDDSTPLIRKDRER